MEERSKRLIDIFIRGGFIILCFILTYIFNVLTDFSYGNTVSLTEGENVKVEIITENGAVASYEQLEDGRIAVNVTKAGANWDDITVILSVNSAEFDTSRIEAELGDAAEEYREHLDALAAGPWIGCMHYRMTGEALLTDTDISYTFTDAALDEYLEGVLSSAANTMKVSNDMTFEKGEGAIAMFTMGAEADGALPEGKYYIETEIAFTGLESGESVLPTAVGARVLFGMLGDTLAKTPVTSFFKVSSLLTFYGMMVAFGAIFFGYVDLRSAIRIGIRASQGVGEAVLVTVRTYSDGYLIDETSYWDDGGSIFRGIVAFILSYMLFLLTIPLRLVVIIIKDIVHLIIGDENYDCYSLLGNVLGSIGVYALLAGVVGLMAGASLLIPAIALPVGVVLLIIAGKLCKDAEENY